MFSVQNYLPLSSQKSDKIGLQKHQLKNPVKFYHPLLKTISQQNSKNDNLSPPPKRSIKSGIAPRERRTRSVIDRARSTRGSTLLHCRCTHYDGLSIGCNGSGEFCVARQYAWRSLPPLPKCRLQSPTLPPSNRYEVFD